MNKLDSLRQETIFSRKGARLRSILQDTKREVKRRPREKDQALTHGWYGDLKVYRTEDLMRHWRVCLKLKYPKRQGENIALPFFLRPQLLRWLKGEGYKRCEAIVAFAVEMWEPLCDRFDIEKAEYPMLNVIWGFREAIRREMEHVKDKTWGAHWTGAEYPEDVA